MAEAAQVARLGQNGESVDRADTRNLPQQLVIDIICEPGMGQPLDLVALLEQAAALRDNHAEHGDGGRVLGHRQRY